MRTIADNIRFALAQKTIRNWDTLYWAIDLHDTVITGKYNRFNEGAVLYPDAKVVLDFLHKSQDHRTILWTSSYQDSVANVLAKFDLKFHYLNENPECKSGELCDFRQKLYFNILLDDKAGFVGETDWTAIRNVLGC
jgi:hypothetical protein